jgi:hypothetical protein
MDGNLNMVSDFITIQNGVGVKEFDIPKEVRPSLSSLLEIRQEFVVACVEYILTRKVPPSGCPWDAVPVKNSPWEGTFPLSVAIFQG